MNQGSGPRRPAAEPEAETRPLTVGDIRRTIANVPDDTPVTLEVSVGLDPTGDDSWQALLRHASIESGSDGQGQVPLLYLWGSMIIDDDEQEAAGQGAPAGRPVEGGPAPSGHDGEQGPEDG